MPINLPTQEDDRYYVIILDDDAPFRIASGDNEIELEEAVLKEAKPKRYIVCQFREFRLTQVMDKIDTVAKQSEE